MFSLILATVGVEPAFASGEWSNYSSDILGRGPTTTEFDFFVDYPPMDAAAPSKA